MHKCYNRKKGVINIAFNHKAFCTRLQKLRSLHQMTQAQVAAAIGTTEKFYSNIETGERLPSLETFVAIVNALSVDANALLVDSFVSSNLKSNLENESGRLFFYQPQKEHAANESDET